MLTMLILIANAPPTTDTTTPLPHTGIELSGQALIVIGNVAMALLAPVVVYLTAKRQNKVDKGQQDLKEMLTELLSGRTSEMAEIKEDIRELRDGQRQLRDGQRTLSADFKSQISYLSDSFEGVQQEVSKLTRLSRHESERRRKAKRAHHI